MRMLLHGQPPLVFPSRRFAASINPPVNLISASLRKPPTRAATKGFGPSDNSRRQPQQGAPKFDDEDAASPDGETFSSRQEYQVYQDSLYRPKRFIGAVELSTSQGEMIES